MATPKLSAGFFNRRCFWYDDDGNPRLNEDGRYGCTRREDRGRNCSFVHPDDPRWSSLKPTHPPGHENLSAAEAQRKAHSARPSTSDMNPWSRTPPRARSPLRTSVHRPRSPPRPSSPRRSRTPPRARSPRSGSRQRPSSLSKSAENFDHRDAAQRPTTTTSFSHEERAHIPSHSFTIPAPPVLRSSTLSRGFSGDSEGAHMPPKDASLEQKRSVWNERITLLAEATLCRSELSDLLKDVENYERISRSWILNNLSEESRSRINTQLADAIARSAAKKSDLKRIIVRLTETNYWPIAPSAVPPERDGRSDMKEAIMELKKGMQDLHNQLQEYRVGHAAVDSKPPPPIKNDESHVAEPPAKRLKLSIDDTARPSGWDNELYDLRDRLLRLEEQSSDLEQEMVQHDHELNTLQTKTEEILGLGAAGSAGSSTRDLDMQPVEQFSRELDIAGRQIEELALEVANLIKQTMKKDAELEQVHSDNRQLLQKVEVLSSQLAANQLELQALNAAVAAYISQSNAKPSSPQLPAMEDIISSVQPALLEMIHSDLQPMLSNTHHSVETMIEDKIKNVYTTVMSSLTPYLQTVDTMSAWMEHTHEGGHSELHDQLKDLNNGGIK